MQMQWQEHTKCSSPSLSNSNKATNAYGGIREEEQRKPQRSEILHSQIPPKATNAYGGRREEEQRRRITKELQVLNPLGSPHLEERWIGGNMNLDLLSLFPQEIAIIIGGIERSQNFAGQQWRRRESTKTWEPLGKMTP